jgi:purine-binding chemotaxis protein CheW
LRAKGEPVGVVVDRVTSVLRLDAESIEATPVTMQRDVSDLIQGVGRTGERMIIVLDSGAILRAMERAT